jgi:hypothetical protein
VRPLEFYRRRSQEVFCFRATSRGVSPVTICCLFIQTHYLCASESNTSSASSVAPCTLTRQSPIFRSVCAAARSAGYRWGARSTTYYLTGNRVGHGSKFPETGWAPLEEIYAKKWAWLEPEPVKVIASRFLFVDRWSVPHYYSLEWGQFIQGLLAHIPPYHTRVYIVTVRAPSTAAESWENWPRIIGTAVSGFREGPA